MTDQSADAAPKAAVKFRIVRSEVSKVRSDAASLVEAAERDLAQRTRERPMQTVVIALAAGWLLGRAL